MFQEKGKMENVLSIDLCVMKLSIMETNWTKFQNGKLSPAFFCFFQSVDCSQTPQQISARHMEKVSTAISNQNL